MTCRKAKLIIATFMVSVGILSISCQKADFDEAPTSFEGFSPFPSIYWDSFKGKNIKYVARYTKRSRQEGFYDTLLFDSVGNHTHTIMPNGDTLLRKVYNKYGFIITEYSNERLNNNRKDYLYRTKDSILYKIPYDADSLKDKSDINTITFYTTAFVYQDGKPQWYYGAYDSSTVTKLSWVRDTLIRTMDVTKKGQYFFQNYDYLKNGDVIVETVRFTESATVSSTESRYNTRYYFTENRLDSIIGDVYGAEYLTYKYFDK